MYNLKQAQHDQYILEFNALFKPMDAFLAQAQQLAKQSAKAAKSMLYRLHKANHVADFPVHQFVPLLTELQNLMKNFLADIKQNQTSVPAVDPDQHETLLYCTTQGVCQNFINYTWAIYSRYQESNQETGKDPIVPSIDEFESFLANFEFIFNSIQCSDKIERDTITSFVESTRSFLGVCYVGIEKCELRSCAHLSLGASPANSDSD